MKLPEKDVVYIDRPDLAETYIDSIGTTLFDGNNLRMEMCITRLDRPTPPDTPTGRRFPVHRVIMPADCMVDLYNQLGRFMKMMEERGMVSRNEPKTASLDAPKK